MSTLQNRDPGSVSPIIQIIAGQTVRYSRTNGINTSEFEDGGIYEVPDHVARGMIERHWAKLANPNGGQPHDPEPPKPPPPQPAPGQEPERREPERDPARHEPEPEPNDDDGEEARALRAKTKRR